MKSDRHHRILVVDASRRTEFLEMWPSLLGTFRDLAEPGEHNTVAVITIDAERVDVVVPGTPIALAPDSLTLPDLAAGSGPKNVAAQLLRIVIDAQVQLDDPKIKIYMFGHPKWDWIRLKDVRPLPNIVIDSNAFGSSRRRILGVTELVAALAAVAIVFLMTPAVEKTGWTVAGIEALEPGQCINNYPYESALNKSPLDIVDCNTADALLMFKHASQKDADLGCAVDQFHRSWAYGKEKYCFSVRMISGMCVPAYIQKGDGRTGALFYAPGACGDPFDNVLRIHSANVGRNLVDLVVDDWTYLADDAQACPQLEYDFDHIGIRICAHLR